MKFYGIALLVLASIVSLTAQTATPPASGDGSEGAPYQISTWQNLYWISQNSSEWGKHFLQTADIDLGTAVPAIATWNAGGGWTPIGNATTQFTGVYDGDGYKIIGLYLNYPGAGEPTSVAEAQALPGNIGLFGYVRGATSDAVIRNLGLLDADVTGGRATGALVGKVLLPSNASSIVLIENCYVAGSSTVRGFGATGGLVGANNTQKKNVIPIIHYCYSTATVQSRFPTNSLINPGDPDELFNIKYGCVVGCNENGLTMDSYGRGNVTGGKRVGGIAGCSIRGAIIRCYATGQARTGFQSPPFTADADPYVGGVVGRVIGKLPPGLGGFQGSGSVQMCYWDVTTSGNTTSGGGSGAHGRTTGEMQTQATFADWDFSGVWAISASQYPRLVWQDGVNVNPMPNTYEGMMAPTVVGDVSQPDDLYSVTSVGGYTVYGGFMPSATETVNISIFSVYSENPDILEGDFPNPENLGGYWKFYCSDDAVLRSAQYFDIQLPEMYLDLWYRYMRDETEVLSWRVVPVGAATYQSGAYIYRVNIADLTLPAPGRADEQGVIEFASDNGGGALPVELSSFSAIQTSEDYVRLEWTTQTETDMNGYNVYRAGALSIAEAICVNDDVIPSLNSSSSETYAYVDDLVEMGGAYWYWLQSVELDGGIEYFGPVAIELQSGGDGGGDTPPIELVTDIVDNFPNPFNPSTEIRFALQEECEVSMQVYNLRGQHMVTLLHRQTLASGAHSVVWIAPDAPSGVYMVRMTAGGQSYTRKIALIK